MQLAAQRPDGKDPGGIAGEITGGRGAVVFQDADVKSAGDLMRGFHRYRAEVIGVDDVGIHAELSFKNRAIAGDIARFRLIVQVAVARFDRVSVCLRRLFHLRVRIFIPVGGGQAFFSLAGGSGLAAAGVAVEDFMLSALCLVLVPAVRFAGGHRQQ